MSSVRERTLLNGLDLFSGIGGLSLALSQWVRPIAYCESDRYAQSVILSRIYDGVLPAAPIWDDVKTLTASHLPSIDMVYGGFPCQDISLMGTKEGLEGERSKLFFEISRLVGELRPRFVFLENVPAITLRGLDRICLEFASLGYDCRWTVVSAAAIGACHIRERWFLLANANRMRLRQECGKEIQVELQSTGKILANHPRGQRGIAESSARSLKPRVVRTGDGISNKVDRAHALGNAVVPIQAKEAFKKLMGLT